MDNKKKTRRKTETVLAHIREGQLISEYKRVPRKNKRADFSVP